jgi:hypothetical protein
MSDVRCKKSVEPCSSPLSIDLSDIYVIVSCVDHAKKFRDILKTVFMRGNKFQGTQYSMILLKCNLFKKHFLVFNPLSAELNPICYLLALLGAHPIFYISGVRVTTFQGG